MTSESITSNPVRACSGRASLRRRDNFLLVLEHHQNNKGLVSFRKIPELLKRTIPVLLKPTFHKERQPKRNAVFQLVLAGQSKKREKE